MHETQTTTVGELIRDREHKYNSGSPTELSEHVDFDLKDHIAQVEAYKFSRHISGSTDSMGREKPFFNISTAASNVWYRATDIDRRNIRIKAPTQDLLVPSFAATQKLQEYMKKDDFGTYLNKWGRVLADYGSAVSKFIEKDGELHAMVIPWTRIIVDSISFDKDVVIELLELTPDELLQRKGYDQEVVRELIDAREARENEKGQDQDEKSEFIKLYEVHGKMPKSFRTGNAEDRYEYEQQMFVVSFVRSKEKGKFDDYILASGREDKHPYMIAHLIEEEDRVMGVGAYEHIFEAQWMTNHTAFSIKNELDLASKIVTQTADDTFMGQNVLNAIETGDILIHADNKPLGRVDLNSQGIGALQAYGQQWENLAKEISSTPDAIRGDTMPSGTAYRSVAIQNRESHSLFELMTENKGLAIERMMREFIIPYLKKQLNTTDEIATTLERAGIEFIDPKFIRYEATKRNKAAVKDILLRGAFDELPSVDQQGAEDEVRGELAELGNQRFLKPSEIDTETWKDVMGDFEWEVDVEITNENTDKEATLTTLTTVLQSIASNPGILQDKNASLLFNKILEETGRISPIELSHAGAAPSAPQQLPQLEQLTPQTPT